MGEGTLSTIFTHLYHLSSLKNCSISDFLVWSENSISFSFGFRHNLSNRETMEVASLLSLVEGYSFREERGDVRIWSPNLLEGVSCKSFF